MHIMKTNPVGWFEIYVQDMPRARAFYEAVFAGELQNLESPGIEMWAFPMHDTDTGASGALVKMEGCPSGGNSTLVYFSCADCSVEASRAAANGGQVFKEKFSIGPHGFIAPVSDTEGNMIGLHSMQ
jgi:predicted enzyme related to lactoylglutathione lyase